MLTSVFSQSSFSPFVPSNASAPASLQNFVAPECACCRWHTFIDGIGNLNFIQIFIKHTVSKIIVLLEPKIPSARSMTSSTIPTIWKKSWPWRRDGHWQLISSLKQRIIWIVTLIAPHTCSYRLTKIHAWKYWPPSGFHHGHIPSSDRAICNSVVVRRPGSDKIRDFFPASSSSELIPDNYVTSEM